MPSITLPNGQSQPYIIVVGPGHLNVQVSTGRGSGNVNARTGDYILEFTGDNSVCVLTAKQFFNLFGSMALVP